MTDLIMKKLIITIWWDWFWKIQMKYLDGQNYVEVKDHRYKINPTEKIILRKRDPPIRSGTQNQVENETQISKNHKVIRDDNNELVVKN